MEEFELFKTYFHSLYNRYILSLLMCRIYAIKKIDGFLVMLPSKVSWNGRTIPLDEEDFSFLENQNEDIKYRLSEMFEVSYDEYIKNMEDTSVQTIHMILIGILGLLFRTLLIGYMQILHMLN